MDGGKNEGHAIKKKERKRLSFCLLFCPQSNHNVYEIFYYTR